MSSDAANRKQVSSNNQEQQEAYTGPCYGVQAVLMPTSGYRRALGLMAASSGLPQLGRMAAKPPDRTWRWGCVAPERPATKPIAPCAIPPHQLQLFYSISPGVRPNTIGSFAVQTVQMVIRVSHVLRAGSNHKDPKCVQSRKNAARRTHHPRSAHMLDLESLSN
jgi:hypothetical protein